jgi:flagellar FliL protein
MAARQAAEAPKATSKVKGKRAWALIGGAVLLLVGLAAGAGIWRMQNPDSEGGKTVQATIPDAGHALLPLGRITVNVASSGALSEKRSRYLVIEPTLLYEAGFDKVPEQPGMIEFKSALRDSYIEFLSQLHENDVYGSAGLAELRSELLRRARLITKSDAPISILLQDFVLQ